MKKYCKSGAELFNHQSDVCDRNNHQDQHDQPDDMERAGGTVPSAVNPTFLKAAGPYNMLLSLSLLVLFLESGFVSWSLLSSSVLCFLLVALS